MKIKHLIKNSLETTYPYAGIESIEKSLRDNSFLVVMDGSSFWGILTPSDIIESPHHLVIDCLHDKPRVDLEQDIESVLILMENSRNPVLPVFDSVKFVGVITQTIITDYLSEYRKELERKISEHTVELAKANEKLKREREELKASETRFRNLVEATSDWVWEVDAQGIYTYASPKVKDILGYEISEVVGKTPFDLMPPDEAKRFFEFFISITAQRKPFTSLENINRHKDGHWVVLETSGVPIFDDDGAFLGYRGIDRDITERKQMEKALRIKDNAIESSINGIMIADLKGKLTYTNNSFLKIWGYDEKEALGKHIIEFCQDEEEIAKIIEELKEKGGWIGELKAKRKGGSLFDVSFSASIVKNSADNPICMMASFIDITETVQLREKLRAISFQDNLTGLHNRRGFLDMAKQELKVAKQRGKELVLFFVDLDGLKWINDTFGHNEGDLALIDTANILKISFREADILARFGGDEFVILATDVSKSSAEILTVRLYKNLTAHNSKETCRHNLSLSIGMSYYNPESPVSLEKLMSQADSAMYEQKKSKRKA